MGDLGDENPGLFLEASLKTYLDLEASFSKVTVSISELGSRRETPDDLSVQVITS